MLIFNFIKGDKFLWCLLFFKVLNDMLVFKGVLVLGKVILLIWILDWVYLLYFEYLEWFLIYLINVFVGVL